jgi:preprotein translocase subunit SecE
MTRQVTAIALGAVVLTGCWTMSNTVLSEARREVQLGVPLLLAAAGLWAVFRLVNFPRFANFLISVEAEMDKVSWADQQFLIRATGVVVVTMLILGAYLWLWDALWFRLFSWIHILDPEALKPK